MKRCGTRRGNALAAVCRATTVAGMPHIRSAPHTSLALRRLPLLTALLLLVAALPAAEPQRNVLVIVVDDLRPELPSYGVERAHAPNLQRLAAEGVVFERAYCQTPVCGPSRASFLTGLRPEGDRFRDNHNRVSHQAPDATTIPGHFRDHGYATRAYGKVFHNARDMAQHWTEPQYRAPKTNASWRRYQTLRNIQIEKAMQRAGGDQRGMPYEVAPDDAVLEDAHIADAAIADIRRHHAAGQPFMLTTGFKKPHLPFVAPARDWERYTPESITLPTSGVPEGAEPAAHGFGELRAYLGIPDEGPVSEAMAVELVRGYLACVSHTDRQIGRLLDTLDELGIADDTVVVVFGDHGWFLHDHGMWTKHSTFHDAVHVPLFVRAPGVEPGRSDALVELVDVFPTISELAGLPIHRQCEGNSFVPVLADPDRPWKRAVFARQGHMDAVITPRYAYTAFRGGDGAMAYDLVEDPVETRNLVRDPAHADTVARCARPWRPVGGRRARTIRRSAPPSTTSAKRSG